ncbi:MAG: (Fe-S)-binding protein [Oligoflexia bacterium]|nr:(Fe-S)-binding protein [Oligoflexia bacterium]
MRSIQDQIFSTATREPLWNIPTYFLIIMYTLFLLSLILLFRNLYRYYIFIAKGVFTEHLMANKFSTLNFKNFFKTIFLQGKVTNDYYAGIFHSMIFYGFLTHLLATSVVMIHQDSPFKIFNGHFYVMVSFLADMGGVSILLGVILGMVRRYMLKPKNLLFNCSDSSTSTISDPTPFFKEVYMYVMLILFVLIGFSLEGIRIILTDSFTQALTVEKYCSPVGWFVAQLFLTIFNFSGQDNINNLTSSFLTAHKILWMIHTISTMLFIGLIANSKFIHLFLLPLSALITRDRQGAVILPMNFQDETAETFGLGDSKDLNCKERFDVSACIECGRCTKVCPANNSSKPLDPKKILVKLKELKQKDVSLFSEEKALFSADELDSCTTCGACMQECPANIEHVRLITNLKRYKVLTLSDIRPNAAATVNKIKMYGNPWGIPTSERFKWAQSCKEDIPIIKANKKVEYLFYVGCAGALDPLGQNITKKMIKLLKKCNIDFALIEGEERCTGDSIRRFGDEYSFDEWAKDNIKFLRQFSFDKILTFCPHCLHTLGKEYDKFSDKDLDGNFKVIHHTELFSSLINSGKIIPKGLNEKTKEFTFHDPCYLGRHHGEYKAARDILANIPNLKLKELDNSKEKSVCCGMGGGNMWYEVAEGEHLAINRLKEIASVNINNVITACPFCMINFNSSKGRYSVTENIEIKDIFDILDESL